MTLYEVTFKNYIPPIEISRLSSKLSQSIVWPSNHGRLILILESVDEVLHRVVMARGIPTNVGIANSGKQCIVILGHKEVQNHQIYLLASDVIFTTDADSKGRLSSIGLDNIGKDNCYPETERTRRS
jgi:hypothetical protein